MQPEYWVKCGGIQIAHVTTAPYESMYLIVNTLKIVIVRTPLICQRIGGKDGVVILGHEELISV
jgi:hypothetical protein